MTNPYDSFAEAYAAETESNLINGYRGRRSWTWLATWPGGGSSTSAAAPAPCSALRGAALIVTGVDSFPRCWTWPGCGSATARTCVPADLQQPAAVPRRRVRRRHRVPGPALPGGLDGTARRAAARAGARGPTHRGREPPRHLQGVLSRRRLLRDQQVLRGQHLRRPERRADLRHRPLHAITDAFTEAGFRIAVIKRAAPRQKAASCSDDLARYPSGAFLCFLFFVLEAV